MEFDEVIKKRASIRKYSSKKPDIELAIAAIEAAHIAPTPGNLDILKYIIVDDTEKINQIAEAAQQPFINQASLLVVVTSDPKQVEKMYDKRAEKYTRQHAGAAIENFLLAITDLGLASCWVGAFNDFQVKTILHIPDNITVEAILPVAYEHKTNHVSQRKKQPLDGKMYFNGYGYFDRVRIKTSQVRRTDI
jgi:nitroreductase